MPTDDIRGENTSDAVPPGGFSVPGMPHGTPGMETGRKDDYQVIAFNANGQQRVFREHTNY